MAVSDPMPPVTAKDRVIAPQRVQSVSMAERTHADRRKADLQPRD